MIWSGWSDLRNDADLVNGVPSSVDLSRQGIPAGFVGYRRPSATPAWSISTRRGGLPGQTSSGRRIAARPGRQALFSTPVNSYILAFQGKPCQIPPDYARGEGAVSTRWVGEFRGCTMPASFDPGFGLCRRGRTKVSRAGGWRVRSREVPFILEQRPDRRPAWCTREMLARAPDGHVRPGGIGPELSGRRA